MKNILLVVAPSHLTRGGITSFIKVFKESPLWPKWNSKWIETTRDTSILTKFVYFFFSIIVFVIVLPKSKIVHIHLSWFVSAFRKFPFFLFAKLFGKKVVLHLHSGSDKIINSKFRFIYRILFLYSDHSIVLAESIKYDLIEHFRFKKVSVLYNPCPRIKEEYRSIKKPNILFAGTLYDVKGYRDLIIAFSYISSMYPDWKIVFAGNGELDKAKKLARSLFIEDKVIFHGWVLDDGLTSLYRDSSFFCLPSYTEGFPMAVLSAWAYGLPVITTFVGGLRDVLVHGENALVIEPGNVKQLAECLELLITNQELRENLSYRSLELSTTIFSEETCIMKLDEIYADLISID